jgi:hypothetical protein
MKSFYHQIHVSVILTCEYSKNVHSGTSGTAFWEGRTLMATSEETARYEGQSALFEQIRMRVKNTLKDFGRPDTALRHGDYTVEGDYLGPAEIVIFIGNLAMLQPNIVADLQQVIREFPGWQIVMTVAVRGHYDDWPNMGLYIRPHEIIDGLQRQYFPKEFQNIEYEGARRGTAYD